MTEKLSASVGAYENAEICADLPDQTICLIPRDYESIEEDMSEFRHDLFNIFMIRH